MIRPASSSLGIDGPAAHPEPGLRTKPIEAARPALSSGIGLWRDDQSESFGGHRSVDCPIGPGFGGTDRRAVDLARALDASAARDLGR